MPVVPKSIPPFEINPPRTSGDKGDPSQSLWRDTQRVFDFIEDERHLTAHKLYLDVKRRVDEFEKLPKRSKRKPLASQSLFKKPNQQPKERVKEEEVVRVKEYLKSMEAIIYKLENRCRIFRNAQHNLNDDEDWTYASTHFGIKTFYRREKDGSLSVKLEGILNDVPLFEQICVLKEVDYHYLWSPFCSSSLTIADLDKLDLVGWFLLGIPAFGLARDGCFRAIGCDNISEDGSILLAGQGIRDIKPGDPPPEDTFLSQDPILEKLDIPDPPSRIGSGRMTIRKFEAVIHILSPTSARTRLVANVDPNISLLPQSLLEFVMKHLAGVVLGKLQSAAKRVHKNPVRNAHARRMRQEEIFYREWLMEKFKVICKERGWEMPAVTAFELTDEQLRREGQMLDRKARRAQTFGGIVEDEDLIDELNVSSISSPALCAPDPDLISELTSRSESTAWGNPLMSYLREMEEKTKARKEAAIAESRQIAAERLRPRELSAEMEARLTELKLAKAKRLVERNKGPGSSAGGSSAQTMTLSQRITFELHSHSLATRVFLVTALVFTLFTLLHPDQMMRFSPVRFSPMHQWYLGLLEDLFVFFYITVCSMVHFLLCDVALVYAFTSIESGKKTGREVKKFYSSNVRYGVALMSFGIEFLSIAKAQSIVALRAAFYYVFRFYDFFFSNVVSPLFSFTGGRISSLVPQQVLDVGDFVFTVIYGAWNVAVQAFATLTSTIFGLMRDFILQSNRVGRSIESGVILVFEAVKRLLHSISGFVYNATTDFEGRDSVILWREEAFDTVKSLFSYTAVFIVTTLVLFTLSTRNARVHVDEKRKDTESSEKSKVETDTVSGEFTASTNSRLKDSSDRAIRGTPATIPEEGELSFSTGKSNETPGIPHLDSTASSRRKRLLRFHRASTEANSPARTKPKDGNARRLVKATTY